MMKKKYFILLFHFEINLCLVPFTWPYFSHNKQMCTTYIEDIQLMWDAILKSKLVCIINTAYIP